MLRRRKIHAAINICVGHTYRIVSIKPLCRCNCRHKLLAMGLIPGAIFRVVRKAPLGDPVEIEIKGFLLSLRAKEIATLELGEVA
ncbi:MAG: ferrous iron transporter A [Gammaproteobacteria bacterium]|nr:ferrous iron transporter A [Gammaproteobacteria bacterium]